MSSVRAAAATAVAGLLGCLVFGAVTAAPAAAAPDTDAASVRLAGAVSPAAPDADTVQTVTIPLTVTNTGNSTLYDVSVSSLRSAPVTSRSALTSAFGGRALEESDATKQGPRQEVPGTLAPGASTRVDYVVDTSDDDGTGICLCFLGVYALDLVVTAADEDGGSTGRVARTQTYLPSLLDVATPAQVGWLWPLLDRPHRLTTGSVFTDDDLAGSVGTGGRLDRALQVVEQVDTASAADPTVARAVTLLLDPDLLDELVTMTRGYTVQAVDGTSTTGTGGPAAAAWLARLAAVLPRHDVRTTLPADPDVVGLAARSVSPQTTPGSDVVARVTAALGLPGGELPPHDLAWPVETDLARDAWTALRASGATGVVATADTGDDGALAAADVDGAVPALLVDPLLGATARDATSTGEDVPAAVQRLVVTAAMTSVAHPADPRYVFVVPARDPDVVPAVAAQAVLATLSLGTPRSPVAALDDVDTGDPRGDLVASATSAPPPPLPVALDAAGTATAAAGTVRAAVQGDATGVVGALADRVQRASANTWVGHDDAAARSAADLGARATTLGTAVQVVVRTSGGYSLASADAPLLLTVANTLAVPVKVRLDVDAAGSATGFRAEDTEVTIPAQSGQTVRVPVTVSRSGRFDVAVTLRTDGGAPIGAPTTIVVTSTAVGAVGTIVTYGAGALLVLALVVRGVRRLAARSRAGSGGTGPDGDARPDATRAEDHPTVPVSPS